MKHNLEFCKVFENIVTDIEQVFENLQLQRARTDGELADRLSSLEDKAIILTEDNSVSYMNDILDNPHCDFSGTYGILRILSGDEPSNGYEHVSERLKNIDLELVRKNLQNSELIVMTPWLYEKKKLLEGTKLIENVNHFIDTKNGYHIFDQYVGSSWILKGINDYLKKEHPELAEQNEVLRKVLVEKYVNPRLE